MASLVTKVVAKKILGETMKNKFGREDPYFETVPATRIDGKINPNKVKKRRKALPPGISKNDAEVLTKVKRRAYRLDLALFSVCGVRFGWGSAIGLIPAIGDVLDALLGLLVLKTCRKIDGGLPIGIQIQMLLNIGLDFVIGIVPFAGDILDAMFRANTRNAVLLEEHLREKGVKNLKRDGKPVPDVDPSEGDYWDEHRDAPLVSDAPSRQPSMRAERDRRDRRRDGPLEPEPVRVKESRGWWGRGRNRPDDVEAGQSDVPSRSGTRTSRPAGRE